MFGLTALKIPAAALYFPVVIGVILIFRSSLIDGLLIVMAYLATDGAFKLMSAGSPGLRVAIDVLMITLFLRYIQLQLQAKNPKKIFGAPLSILFFLHAAWIFVQYLNPYSIGLVPSIAAFKVYISSLLLYFIVFSAVEDEADIRKLMGMCAALVVLQVVVTIFHFQIGEAGLIKWSHHYLGAMGDRFRGIKFRPFGTSNVPGGSSTLLYLLTPMSIGLFIMKARLWSYGVAALIFWGSAAALVTTQVRSAQVKCLLGISILFLVLALKRRGHKALGFLALIFITSGIALGQLELSDPRIQAVVARTNSLENFSEVWSDRSQGVYETTMQIVYRAPFGIGLSRVGAASEPFKDRIAADQVFGGFWSFADNLYKALLIEVGVPGLIIYLSFLFGTILVGISGLLSHTILKDEYLIFQGAAIGAVIAACTGHLGSEGFLYQPESGITWIFIGALVKIRDLSQNVSWQNQTLGGNSLESTDPATSLTRSIDHGIIAETDRNGTPH